ncbi:MAG: GC-type dockerin domain-anchored protein, partial [Planctomyces sp.]
VLAGVLAVSVLAAAGGAVAIAQPTGCGPGLERSAAVSSPPSGLTVIETMADGSVVLAGGARIAAYLPLAMDLDLPVSPPVARKAVRIARWDNGWRFFAQEPGGTINALARLADGTLVAGGAFTTEQPSGRSLQQVATWNGQQWETLGGGVTAIPTQGTASVNALLRMPNGDLIVAGRFSAAGGVAAANIARWDGQAWQAMGLGVNGAVSRLTLTPAGEVLASGEFTTADGLPARSIARWNGSSWSALGDSSNIFPNPRSVVATANGDVHVLESGGWLSRFAGGAWTLIASGMGGTFNPAALISFDGRPLVLGVLDSARVGSPPLNPIGVVNGAAVLAEQGWTGLPSSNGRGLMTRVPDVLSGSVSSAAVLPDGRILATGFFNARGDVAAGRLAVYDGQKWAGLSATPRGQIFSLTTLADGRLVAGTASGIDVRNAAGWTGLGSTPTSIPLANVVATLPDGRLLVGGSFLEIEGVQARRLAVWNGSAWAQFAGGAGPVTSGGSVTRIHVASDGAVVVLGNITTVGGSDGIPETTVNGVARWFNGAWSDMSSGTTEIRNLTNAPNGDLLAFGTFTPGPSLPAGTTTASVARWDVSAWVGIAGALPLPSDGLAGTAFGVAPDGSIIASARNSGSTAFVHRWDGSVWRPVGDTLAGELDPAASPQQFGPLVRAMAISPAGNLYIAGNFRTSTANGQTRRTLNGVARLVGDRWEPVGPGLGTNGAATMRTLPDGTIAVAGAFQLVGNEPSSFIAYITNPDGICPCSAADIANADGEAAPTGGADGQVTNGDFIAFFSAFFADEGDPARLAADIADADGRTLFDTPAGGPDGAVTNADFTAFFAAFFDGCGG